MQIIRIMPVIVVLSVVLALVVCGLAWVLAGRPCRARARHGIEPGRQVDDELDLLEQVQAEPAHRFIGPDDDPDFIRELARTIAERGRPRHDGDASPERD